MLAKNGEEKEKIKKHGITSKNVLRKNIMILKNNSEQPPCKLDIIKPT